MANKKDADLKLKEALHLIRKEQEQEMNGGCEKKELHRFSKEFERKISKLFQKKKSPVRFRPKGYAIRMGAAVTSLLLIGTILVGIQVDAIQMPEINFTLITHEDHSEMRMVIDERWGVKSSIYAKELYQPKKLPIGYKRVKDNTGKAYCILTYEKGNQILRFQQTSASVSLRVNSEFGEGEKLISNHSAYYYYSNHQNENILVWSDGDWQFQIYGRETADTMIQIAENLEKVE